MSTSTPQQTRALVCRFIISLTRSPITNFLKLILWPCLVLGPCVYILSSRKDDDFYKNFPSENYLPIFTWSSTIFIVYSSISWMVSDRSSGMKSLMMSMGLRRQSYYLANFVCTAIQLAPIMLTINLLSIIYVFEDTLSSSFMISAIYALFVIQIIGLIFALSSIITSNSWTPSLIVVFLLMMLEPTLISFIVVKFNITRLNLTLFISHISPYQAINTLCRSYTICKHCDETKRDTFGYLSQPPHLIALAMLFWSLLTYSFALWFNEVCPWQNDSAIKHPLFCFFSKKLKQLRTVTSSSGQNTKFFESSHTNRPVGISVRNLSKKFGRVTAIDDLSFEIYQGETTLLLGHNGAGKTTLMQIILKKLNSDQGSVQVMYSNRGSSKFGVGVCPQTSIIDDFLNVRQHIKLFLDIKTNMPAHMQKSHIQRTLEDVSLSDQAGKLPSELSGGMKRKLSLAMAFVGDSNVLILDEPSSGLDPDSRVFVWNAIRRYRTDRTVLLSTQHMEEADYLGDRIAIMKAGKIVCCGSSTFLNNIFGAGYKLRVQCQTSHKENVLNYVRKYFGLAKLSENDQIVDSPIVDSGNSDSIGEMIIELMGEKSDDLEMRLIHLLEDLESGGKEHGVLSHTLRSSSIEDVLLNTNRSFEDDIDSSQSRIDLTRQRMEKLTELNSRNREGGQLTCLRALMIKHLITMKRRLLFIIFFRVISPLIGSYSLVDSVFTQSDSSLLVAFIILHFTYLPVEERASKFKTIQLTSHVTYITYWAAHLLTDLGFVAMYAIFVNIFVAFYLPPQEIGATIGIYLLVTFVIVMMGLSGALLSYLVSHIADDPKVSVIIMMVFFSGKAIANFIVTILGLTISLKLMSMNDYIKYIFIALFPNAATEHFLNGLLADCNNKGCSYELSSILIGGFALIAQAISYGSLLYFVEYQNIHLEYYFNWRTIKALVLNRPVSATKGFEVDSDVLAESTSASNLIKRGGPKENCSLIAANLSKSYVKGVKVVEHLHFTVKAGECFGLLGVNGAGKSTTFSMIASDLSPDEGLIWLSGKYSDSNLNEYRRNLAYDPQSNPLTSLNAIESFTMMARLRLMDERIIPEMVRAIIELLEMSEHARKTAGSLSGGTKRKLALGMSLVGNAKLLALDEPTAGIDPLARRSIWQVLRTLRAECRSSIIISSHAMEECEAICDRISIMTQGQLRCIGSFLHLRSKFRRDCNVRLTICGDEETDSNQKLIDELDQLLEYKFPHSIEMTDKNFNGATFKVSEKSLKRSLLFRTLRQFKLEHSNCNYMVNDSSLEDIFLLLARENRERSLTRESASTAV